MSAVGQHSDQLHHSGEQADAGSFACSGCGYSISLDHADALPACPSCGGEEFKRGSLFEQTTMTHVALARNEAPGGWLASVRERIAEPGKYLAFHIDGHPRVVELDDGWSRIGRSGSADIRLDDSTVSRRHAVVVRTPDGELRVLDDRSTNGIAVNGEPVDWSPLADGDELQVGRYTLHVIETAGTAPTGP